MSDLLSFFVEKDSAKNEGYDDPKQSIGSQGKGGALKERKNGAHHLCG